MAITEKTRKILWGRAASRCSICRSELVKDGADGDPESVVGDECHIIAQAAAGPRGGEMWPEPLDSYSNLILLCRVHHKLADDQPNQFTSENLRLLKRAHEDWVRITLGKREADAQPGTQPVFTWRLQTGRDVTNLLSGVHGYHLDNDSPRTEAEAEIIGNFLQLVHDFGEIWDDMEPYQHVQAQRSLTNELLILEESGFVAFGTRMPRAYSMNGTNLRLMMAVVRIVRADDPHIVDFSIAAAPSPEPTG